MKYQSLAFVLFFFALCFPNIPASVYSDEVPSVGPSDGVMSDGVIKSGIVGRISVELTPGGKKGLEAIHQERADFYKGIERMRKEDAKMLSSSPLASLFVRMRENGELIGAFKKPRKGNSHHHEIWTYNLNKNDNTSRVVFIDGKSDGQPALVALAYDGGGKFLGSVALTTFDAHSLSRND